MKPPCVMLKQLDYFVGRQDIFEKIQERLKETGYVYLEFLEGLEGIGKTTFLIKLFTILQEQKEYHPVWTCMRVFDPERKVKIEDTNSLTHLTDNLDDYPI